MSTDAIVDDLSLRAGPLTMQLDRNTGFLRDVRWGNLEVLRGIYVAVRDSNWDTVKPRVSHLSVVQREDSFDVTFWVACQRETIDFRWKGEIRGSAEGQIEYRMHGRAYASFRRNRIGFCVLHGSATTAGTDCEIQHVDGNWQKSQFPDSIAPHQPFLSVRAIRHRIAPGVAATVICEGDEFETEDQRNWTDASFKTYCTPLASPFPVAVPEGTEIAQSVQLRLEGEAIRNLSRSHSSRFESSASIPAKIGRTFRFPGIGLCIASHGKPLSPGQQRFLARLKLDHLRVDLSLTSEDLEPRLRAATEQANQLDTDLHVAIALNPDLLDEQWKRFGRLVNAVMPPVAMWLVYQHNHTCASDAMLRQARTVLADVTPAASFAAGTNANFAELNRDRPRTQLADWIAYSINAQVHAFDNRSVMETLEAQGDTVRTAKTFVSSARICISPITLKPRFNAVATGPKIETAHNELPFQVDERQPTLFTAAWTLGTLATLAGAGAESLTFFETTGWRGAMELDEGCPLPELFPSQPGQVFPVGQLFSDLAGLRGSECSMLGFDTPLTVGGFIAERQHGGTAWLANLTDKPIVVQLPNAIARAKHRSLRFLDPNRQTDVAESVPGFDGTPQPPMTDCVALDEYLIARIDYQEQG